MSITPKTDILCFSHLRWNFVYQRPQHLMSLAARQQRVFYVEEPVFSETPHFDVQLVAANVYVVLPHFPSTFTPEEVAQVMERYLSELLKTYQVETYLLWYYSPMFIPWATKLEPALIVYDCMDELSLFAHAPTGLQQYERDLLAQADVVFTGGMSLYESKRQAHRNVHCFPSSIDQAHFRQARTAQVDPGDQALLPHPRLGYAGVLDERLDLALLANLADVRPDWHLVMLGPVVKIHPSDLPQRPNIHYLGMKAYEALPAYMSGWDVGILPFALNDATRFISPTKTPEYLAAGLPVVSTAIRDVVRTYGGDANLVQIWEDAADPVPAVEQALQQGTDLLWRRDVDTFLAPLSWEQTWAAMDAHLQTLLFQVSYQ
jgi:UDP-galactopyranose mutase